MLFLLPFAAAGAVSAVLALQRRTDWREAVLLAVFAVTFGGVGFGGMAAAVAGRKKLKERRALEVSHPDSPWLWRSDWASGRIDDGSRAALAGAWAFTHSSLESDSIPSGFLGVRAALYQGNRAGYIALLFPLVGAGLLVWAIRLSLRYRKYGVSRLTLSTVPGTIGHSLRGLVQATTALEPDDGFRVTLSCVRRVTTQSGKSDIKTRSRSSGRRTVWSRVRFAMMPRARAPRFLSGF